MTSTHEAFTVVSIRTESYRTTTYGFAREDASSTWPCWVTSQVLLLAVDTGRGHMSFGAPCRSLNQVPSRRPRRRGFPRRQWIERCCLRRCSRPWFTDRRLRWLGDSLLRWGSSGRGTCMSQRFLCGCLRRLVRRRRASHRLAATTSLGTIRSSIGRLRTIQRQPLWPRVEPSELSGGEARQSMRDHEGLHGADTRGHGTYTQFRGQIVLTKGNHGLLV